MDAVVSNAQTRQGASNVTMRNIVTSLRQMSEMDWADFFEAASLVEVRLRDDALIDYLTKFLITMRPLAA